MTNLHHFEFAASTIVISKVMSKMVLSPYWVSDNHLFLMKLWRENFGMFFFSF